MYYAWLGLTMLDLLGQVKQEEIAVVHPEAAVGTDADDAFAVALRRRRDGLLFQPRVHDHLRPPHFVLVVGRGHHQGLRGQVKQEPVHPVAPLLLPTEVPEIFFVVFLQAPRLTNISYHLISISSLIQAYSK